MTTPRRVTLAAALRRYLGVTVLGVAANLTLYLFLARRFGLYEPIANVLAALIVIGPRFYLHKYWVWRHRRRERIGYEARLHGLLTAAGLGLSTVTAWVLARADAGAALLAVGNVSAFGVIWITRFALSHFHLFAEPDASAGHPA